MNRRTLTKYLLAGGVVLAVISVGFWRASVHAHVLYRGVFTGPICDGRVCALDERDAFMQRYAKQERMYASAMLISAVGAGVAVVAAGIVLCGQKAHAR
jgi:hypothetical protein